MQIYYDKKKNIKKAMKPCKDGEIRKKQTET